MRGEGVTFQLEHHPIFDQISLCKKHTFVCLATHMQSQPMRGTVALVETVVRETTPISQSTKPLKSEFLYSCRPLQRFGSCCVPETVVFVINKFFFN